MPGVLYIEETGTERLVWITEIDGDEVRYYSEPKAGTWRRFTSFTHYLDLPMLFLIIALCVRKPTTWEMFLYGSLIAIGLASFFTMFIPRMYPWGNE